MQIVAIMLLCDMLGKKLLKEKAVARYSILGDSLAVRKHEIDYEQSVSSPDEEKLKERCKAEEKQSEPKELSAIKTADGTVEGSGGGCKHLLGISSSRR